MTTTTDPFDLLAQGIAQAVHGRICWRPAYDNSEGLVWNREYLGLVEGLTWGR